MTVRTNITTTLLIVIGAAFLPHAAYAEEPGIVVAGVGEVRARPTRAEIVLNTAGSAELTGDAITKYQDAMRRTLQAIEGLKLSTLEIKQEGLGVGTTSGQQGQQVIFDGGDETPNIKPEMAISRSLRVSLTKIETLAEDESIQTLARILDAAQDSGAKLVSGDETTYAMMQMMGQSGGEGTAVTFVLDNVEALREQAYQKAFAHAKSRAQRLAKLADAELGSVLSVSESAVGGDDPQSLVLAMYGGGESSANQEKLRITADKFQEIPVQVALEVRFALQPKAK